MWFFKNLFKKEFNPPQYGVREREDYLPDKRNLLDEEVEPIPFAEEIIWQEKKPEEFRHFYNGEYSQNGSGSCFPAGTLVLTEDLTYKPISEIQVGERVFTHTGKIGIVTKTYKRRWQGRMVKITPRGFGEGILSTLEHPYLIAKQNENGRIEYKWKKAQDITKQDYLVVPIINTVKDKTLHWYEKDENFLYLLGVYLAEGSIDNTRVKFTINADEYKFREKIIKSLHSIGIENISLRFRKNSKALDLSFCNKLWSKVFLEMGGKLADKKRINPRLMWVEPKLQMKIFEGWADGDGHKDEKERELTIVTVSPYLAFQFRDILIRNGLIPYLTIRSERIDKKGVHHKKVYVIDLYQSNRKGLVIKTKNVLLYRVLRKEYPSRPRNDRKGVTLFGGGHVYNLEVEGDHSYLVYGFAVHNCLGFQLALMLEQEEYLENKVRRKLSARSIYGLGYAPGGGMYVESALKIVRDKGATLEYLLPSNNKNEREMRDLSDYKLDAKEIAKIYKPSAYVYLADKSFDRIARVIERTGKVLGCCIAGDSNFGFNKNNGFVKPPGNDRNKWWYHAITLTDYGLINGKKYISFEHCWGKTGYKGLGYGFLGEEWLPYIYVKPYYFRELPDDYHKGKIDFHYQWTRDLALRSRGIDVAMLQEALKILGFYAWSNPTSGYYGYLTYKAVKKFQEAYKDEILKPLGLNEPTGYFGRKSRSVLNKIFK